MRMLSSLTARLASARGFTLMEMVIVVAVLAIMVSISTPAIYKFMQMRDIQHEETVQGEIIKAMKAYIADKGVLPNDYIAGNPRAWAQELAGYTNLSVNEIFTDTWNKDRVYLMRADTTRNIMGTNVPIYYATVSSMGPNVRAENRNASGNAISGISVTNNGTFSAVTDPAWWRNQANPTTSFSGLSAGGDDIMVRFTDYAEKLQGYNKTLERLDRLSQALETYARSGFAERSMACSATTPPANCVTAPPELSIYYPKSSNSESPTDSAHYTNNTLVVANQVGTETAAQATARRNGMLNLTRLLGLPDEFCCSAVENGADNQPKAFYYFSNPRPRATATTCGARPTNASTVKLPARVTTINNAQGTTGATCG